jgi:predicted ATPase/DNA-binding winged helix-turn-helix (wHTH) protein
MGAAAVPEQARQPVVYEAGEWEVDLGRRELRARRVRIPIGGRAFEIIEVLVQSAGELVTKDELMGRVWPGAIVEENTLQVHISAVRKALGPDRGMLKTASGRGYRLLGPWTIRQESTSADTVDLDSARGPVGPFQTNVPLAASALIGRSAAALHLQDLLSAYRVVTLTGPGGIGKTRLALEVARGLFPTFQGDVWLVELVSLSDPALVPSAVAWVLGLRLGSDEITPESIARALGRKKILLILDNCEHLVDAAARFAETIVHMCPRASVLATSQEVLRIEGEYVYRVPPLDVPPEHQEEPGTVLGHSAVQLFIARTRALHADLSPHPDNLAVIAAICRRLDGIPLAIEFAAARAAAVGVRQVAARLDDRFGLLTGGRRTALPRHRTLRATLDWSYELLPDPERCLLRRLAVFSAGFTLEAATAVGGDGASASTVAEGIANLVAKSLVTLDGSAPAGRWRLLETIRAYALEKLAENGEAEPAARRHAEFFRDLFAPISSALALQPKTESLAHYVRELDNVRAALDRAFSPIGDTEIGVVLTAAYVPVWLHLSLMAECRERAKRALDSLETESSLSAALRMQLHIALGTALLQSSGVEERTEEVLAKALEIAEDLDDVDSQLRALWALWGHRYNMGEHRAARPLAEQFSRLASRKGDPADVLVGDRLMGISMHYAGDQAEARRRLEGVLDLYVPPSDQRHAMWFHHDQRVVARLMLARVLCLQGLVDQAKHHAQASLEDAQATDQTLTLRYVLGWAVCPISLMTGDLAAAEQSVAMMIDLATRRHLPFWNTVARGLEGTLLIRRGEFAAGSVLLRIALDKIGYADLLGVLAEGLAGLGRLGEALATIDQALERLDRTGEHWCLAELLRIKGELLIQEAGDQSVLAAEGCFHEALDVARQQGALFWELRSALSLAGLSARQDRPDDARKTLAPVYGRFTEGFDTADMRSARAMLESLPSHRTGPER